MDLGNAIPGAALETTIGGNRPLKGGRSGSVLVPEPGTNPFKQQLHSHPLDAGARC